MENWLLTIKTEFDIMKEGEIMKRDFDKELTVRMMVYARDTYPYDFTYDELFDMCIDTYNNVCRGEVKNLIWWFEREKGERDDKYVLEDIEDILMELKDIYRPVLPFLFQTTKLSS